MRGMCPRSEVVVVIARSLACRLLCVGRSLACCRVSRVVCRASCVVCRVSCVVCRLSSVVWRLSCGHVGGGEWRVSVMIRGVTVEVRGWVGMGGCAWLCVVVRGDSWLFVVIRGYAWLWVVMGGLCVVGYGWSWAWGTHGPRHGPRHGPSSWTVVHGRRRSGSPPSTKR